MKCNLYPAVRRGSLLLCWIVTMICSLSVHGQIITTVAGTGHIGYTGDGAVATAAELFIPSSMAFDTAHNLYINDQKNSCVRKIDKVTGFITTVAGNGTVGFSGDYGLATNAQLRLNWGIAIDKYNNLYISDQVNYRVRKVNPFGIITTIAGSDTLASTGDGGLATAANIGNPVGIAVDTTGNIYIGEEYSHKVRMINTSGIISTIAGTGDPGDSGDGGPAVFAKFIEIIGVSTDVVGNIYICDRGSNKVRMINTSGIITTIAGNGVAGFSGDNGPATLARLNRPSHACADNKGNIYITDQLNNRIRKISPDGIIKTVAGTGSPGFNGDGAAAVLTKLDSPSSTLTDDSGNVYIADAYNNRVRKMYKVLRFNRAPVALLDICQDVSSQIDSLLGITDITNGRTDIWSIAAPAHHGTVVVTYTATSSGGIINPVGLSYTPTGGYSGADSFKVKVSNGADSDVITIYVNVNRAPSYAGVINGPSGVCVGSSIVLTDTLGSGTWSITNLNAVVSNGVVTGESPGLDTVIYMISNKCGNAFATKVITIYPLPDAGTITGSHQLCAGAMQQLSETVTGGVWSCSNGNATISTGGLVTGITPGNVSVAYTVTNSFCLNAVTFPITVMIPPVAGISSPKNELCVGETISLTGTPAGGTWMMDNTNVSITPGGQVTGITAGTVTVSYIVTNLCGADTATQVLTVNPLPVRPAVTQVENTLYGPKGYATYQWLQSDTLLTGANADTLVLPETGWYALTVTNSFGCSATSPTLLYVGCTVNDIEIYPNPTASVIYIQWCKKMTVKLLCADGREVGIDKGVNQVDLTGLANGVYMLELFDLNGIKIKTRRIIKMK